MSFTIETFYNPHIATNRTDAVLTITHTQADAAKGTDLDYLSILDVSGSMDKNDKLNHAKIALRKSLNLLPIGSRFAVIIFNERASVLIPFCDTSPESIEKAQKAIQSLKADGGTAMSQALHLAKSLFEKSSRIKIAQFLTDGENAKEDQKNLETVLNKCRGFFQCNCRGIGTDWHPHELRLIANTLSGTADAISSGEDLINDFREMIQKASSASLASATLRLWLPKTAKIISVKQMMPEIIDLTPLGVRVDEKLIDFSLGPWGAETRDYHIGIELADGLEGDEVLACRPNIIYEENSMPQKIVGPNIVAIWSKDEHLTTRINAQVAHYTGQTELADSIKEGLGAKSSGDMELATKLLGKAVKLANESGNDEVTRRLKKVVDIVDADAGTVRIKASNKSADLELDMGGTRTVRRRSATS